MRDLLAERGEVKEVRLDKKAGGLLQGHLPLEDGRVYQAGDLSSADQEIPDELA